MSRLLGLLLAGLLVATGCGLTEQDQEKNRQIILAGIDRALAQDEVGYAEVAQFTEQGGAVPKGKVARGGIDLAGAYARSGDFRGVYTSKTDRNRRSEVVIDDGQAYQRVSGAKDRAWVRPTPTRVLTSGDPGLAGLRAAVAGATQVSPYSLEFLAKGLGHSYTVTPGSGGFAGLLVNLPAVADTKLAGKSGKGKLQIMLGATDGKLKGYSAVITAQDPATGQVQIDLSLNFGRYPRFRDPPDGADRARDVARLASALRAADSDGVDFKMSERLSVAQGEGSSGEQSVLESSAEGILQDNRAQFVYRVNTVNGPVDFEVILADGYFHIRRPGEEIWRRTPLAGTRVLMAPVQLVLLRQSVELARSVSSSQTLADAPADLHGYVVVPAADQVEQLQSVSGLNQAQEKQFRAGSHAKLQIVIADTDPALREVSLDMDGVDPVSGTRQTVESTAKFTARSGSRAQITAPRPAIDTAPDKIFL
jgi:hypothetical protein